MSNLTKGRRVYKPFHYEKAYGYWEKQQQAHWLATEVPMSGDLQDWELNLTESEKNLVSMILKSFVNFEILIEDYWTSKVAKWFPHPEIAMMCAAFGSMESIHASAYAHLNDTLGMLDYEAFLKEPSAKIRLDRLLETPGKTKEDIARSLAIFSGFTEGVSLFSSFAVLLSFSRVNKLKGVGQIISFSIRDESLHSEAGCWLFREFIKENPNLWTDDLKKTIYEAARLTVSLEDNFIDKAFEMGNIESISSKDLKNFIRNRANVKLGDLGLKTNWRNIDQDSLKKMEWFDYLSTGVEQQDFFANRVSDYAVSSMTIDDMF